RRPVRRQGAAGRVPADTKPSCLPTSLLRGFALKKGAMRPADMPHFSLKVLTMNIHKGFSFFNRKFILHELRDAVRTVAADVVFLQEVHGTHAHHSQRFTNWPQAPHYEFLADSIWPTFAYGRNAIYPHGDHGNALLSKFPIARYHNRDVSIGVSERRGMLHCVLHVPERDVELHAICVHLGLTQTHRVGQIE